jgi:putative endonuclease
MASHLPRNERPRALPISHPANSPSAPRSIPIAYMKIFHVYILASKSRVLYVGVTSDLISRLHQHRNHAVAGFTARYRVTRLVHFEQTDDVHAAIAREKQIKGWRRSKKVALIEAGNPTWADLGVGWFEPPSVRSPIPPPPAGPSLRSG